MAGGRVVEGRGVEERMRGRPDDADRDAQVTGCRDAWRSDGRRPGGGGTWSGGADAWGTEWGGRGERGAGWQDGWGVGGPADGWWSE